MLERGDGGAVQGRAAPLPADALRLLLKTTAFGAADVRVLTLPGGHERAQAGGSPGVAQTWLVLC